MSSDRLKQSRPPGLTLSLILLLAAIAISFRSAPFLDFVDYTTTSRSPVNPAAFEACPLEPPLLPVVFALFSLAFVTVLAIRH